MHAIKYSSIASHPNGIIKIGSLNTFDMITPSFIILGGRPICEDMIWAQLLAIAIDPIRMTFTDYTCQLGQRNLGRGNSLSVLTKLVNGIHLVINLRCFHLGLTTSWLKFSHRINIPNYRADRQFGGPGRPCCRVGRRAWAPPWRRSPRRAHDADGRLSE